MEQFRKSINLSRSSSLGSRSPRSLLSKTESQMMNSNLGENENFKCFNLKTSQFDKILNEFICKIEKSSSPEIPINDKKAKVESPKFLRRSIITDDSASLVSKWLEAINKEHFTHEFLFNGYDDINFIKNIMALEDLDSIGITNEQDIDDIIHGFSSLPDPPPVDAQSSEKFDAKYLLNLCNLDIYLDSFIEQGYCTYEKISTLSNFTLSVVLDVQYLGHRKRLMYYIDDASNRFEKKPLSDSSDDLQEQKSPSLEGTESQDFKDPNTSSSVSSIETTTDGELMRIGGKHQKTKSLFLSKEETEEETKIDESVIPPNNTSISNRRVTFSVYNNPLELQLSKQLDADNKRSKKGSQTKLESFFKKFSLKQSNSKNDSKMEMIPHLHMPRKSEQFLTTTKDKINLLLNKRDASLFTRKKEVISEPEIWMHTSAQLFHDSIEIKAKFIGMYPIKNIFIKGRKMINESITKLKAQSSSSTKFPEVLIKISSSSICLINDQTKKKICSHEMTSIYFCAQDTSDQRVFCYVYKEESNQKYLCNAFRCSSMKLCTEAVLAIGLAFKIC